MDNLVQNYFDSVPEDRKSLFDQLHKLILSLYPEAELVMSDPILTYRARSGWVGLGYWKDGVTLYTSGPVHIGEFNAKHAAIKTGKGSINFRLTDEVPLEDLKKVITHAIENRK
jgi:uncharacterized protein YdhG (YjbR/CyaY superfamily)